jgi:sulfide:quinone oxidoreductase
MTRLPSLPHHSPTAEPFQVVIAGGGVAALEASLALHELAGDRVEVTLLSASHEFVYRPMAVLEPFVDRPPRRLALARFAAERGATLVHDTVDAVDTGRRTVRTGNGRELPYDALLIATGAIAAATLAGAIPISPAHLGKSLGRLIEEIDGAEIESLAFVAPRPSWPLPVYEVALLAAERARDRRPDMAITIVTAEQRPVESFGEAVSAAVSELLAQAGIEVITGTRAELSGDVLTLEPGGRQVRYDRVVTLPRLDGPAIDGLPGDVNGFLPVTAQCEVVGAERVYAAGDATQFPVKFGGIAAQQADAAATAIAALAGASVVPAPFDGTVHGMLLAGANRNRLYFSAEIQGTAAVSSQAGDTPTASTEAKIAARYLGPYLDGLWADGPRWLANQLAWETTLRILEAQDAHRRFSAPRN